MEPQSEVGSHIRADGLKIKRSGRQLDTRIICYFAAKSVSSRRLIAACLAGALIFWPVRSVT